LSRAEKKKLCWTRDTRTSRVTMREPLILGRAPPIDRRIGGRQTPIEPKVWVIPGLEAGDAPFGDSFVAVRMSPTWDACTNLGFYLGVIYGLGSSRGPYSIQNLVFSYRGWVYVPPRLEKSMG